jgi:ESS family glutamate:Na+ symporter
MEYVLDPRQTIIMAILVLFMGKYLTRKLAFFREYNIPEPVTGGVLVSLLMALVFYVFDFQLVFNLDGRDTFLLIFFTSIGLSSRLATLMAGGRSLLIMLGLAVFFLFIQNFTGLLVSFVTGSTPLMGILSGSISLSGGHGTAIAWAPTFIEQYGISNALELGLACATFGLVLGGVLGGPIARYLISKYKLESSSKEHITVGMPQQDSNPNITVNSVLNALLILCIAIGMGIHLNMLLVYLGFKLPLFVSCLLSGIILTNTVPPVFKNLRWPTGTPTLALISDLSLGLFLSMSMMSLQLWKLADLVGPLVILLVAQVIVISLFVIFVVFRLLGKNYDAAVISAGYTGMALGATPTAIANMTAVAEKFGASPQAFLVIPLVGAFFVDIANAFVVKLLLAILS